MEGTELEFLMNSKFNNNFFKEYHLISEEQAKGFITAQRRPLFVICNTDPSWLSGRHWVAFYFTDKQYAEFFDSFGNRPEHYNSNFSQFLQLNSKDGKYKYNSWKLQENESNVCGLYCLLYGVSKLYVKNYADFIFNFSPHNEFENDRKCVQMVEDIFDVRLNVKR